LRPLLGSGQPIDILIGIVRHISVRPEDIRTGRPLLNSATEMSPVDEQFRARLKEDFPCVAGRNSCALRKRTVRRNSSP
jgi:hypothetical protein